MLWNSSEYHIGPKQTQGIDSEYPLDPILNSLLPISHFHEHQAKYPVSKETKNQLAQNTPTIIYLKSYDDVDDRSTFHCIDTRHIRRAIQIAFIVIFCWRLRRPIQTARRGRERTRTLAISYDHLHTRLTLLIFDFVFVTFQKVHQLIWTRTATKREQSGRYVGI